MSEDQQGAGQEGEVVTELDQVGQGARSERDQDLESLGQGQITDPGPEQEQRSGDRAEHPGPLALVGVQSGEDEGPDLIEPVGTGDHDGCQPAQFEVQHRSEEHTSELQSLMRNSYAVFCLKKKKKKNKYTRKKNTDTPI